MTASTKHAAPTGEAAWQALAGDDARAAHAVMRQLAAAPDDAVALLRPRLTPVPRPDEKRLAQLLAQLDSVEFEERDAAQAELAKAGEAALPACRAALLTAASLELRRRLESLLEHHEAEQRQPSPERLRLVRAVELLEMANSPACRKLLAALANGAPGAQLTEEAQAALRRGERQASAR